MTEVIDLWSVTIISIPLAWHVNIKHGRMCHVLFVSALIIVIPGCKTSIKSDSYQTHIKVQINHNFISRLPWLQLHCGRRRAARILIKRMCCVALTTWTLVYHTLQAKVISLQPQGKCKVWKTSYVRKMFFIKTQLEAACQLCWLFISILFYV